MQVNIILNCHPSRKCRYFYLPKIILRLRMIFLVSNLRFYSLLINFFTDKKVNHVWKKFIKIFVNVKIRLNLINWQKLLSIKVFAIENLADLIDENFLIFMRKSLHKFFSMQVNIILNCHPSRKCRYFIFKKSFWDLEWFFWWAI